MLLQIDLRVCQVIMLVCFVMSRWVTAAVYEAKSFGAAGDGITKDTLAIQKLIDRVAEEKNGTVRLACGKFLCGTLFLKSGLTLEIAEDAVLLGSTDLADYPPTVCKVRSYTDNYTDKSLIYAESAVDISIRGKGTIDGQGASFPGEYLVRPYGLRIIACTNVVVEDVHLRNSAMWMEHYLACENVRISGINVYNHCNKNNDMIDIDGCRNVLISNCVGDSDDDGITLKSTLERPCENVKVVGCKVSSHCNSLKCGTESSGGFKNISIENCIVQPSVDDEPIYGKRNGLSGIALEIVDGGTMDNVVVSDVKIKGTISPIFVRLGDRGRPFKKNMERPPVGTLKNIVIKNIEAEGAITGCPVSGLEGHYIENLVLENLSISSEGGGTKPAIRPPEVRDRYPECTMFGKLPASGLYCRHVKGLTLKSVRFSTVKTDERSTIVLDDVENAVMDGKPIGRVCELP